MIDIGLTLLWAVLGIVGGIILGSLVMILNVWLGKKGIKKQWENKKGVFEVKDGKDYYKKTKSE